MHLLDVASKFGARLDSTAEKTFKGILRDYADVVVAKGYMKCQLHTLL